MQRHLAYERNGVVQRVQKCAEGIAVGIVIKEAQRTAPYPRAWVAECRRLHLGDRNFRRKLVTLLGRQRVPSAEKVDHRIRLGIGPHPTIKQWLSIGRGYPPPCSQSVIMEAWTTLGPANTSRLQIRDAEGLRIFQSCCAPWHRRSRSVVLIRWRYSILRFHRRLPTVDLGGRPPCTGLQMATRGKRHRRWRRRVWARPAIPKPPSFKSLHSNCPCELSKSERGGKEAQA